MLTRTDGVMPGGRPYTLWIIGDARPDRPVPAAVLAIGGHTLIAAPIDGSASATQMVDLGAALGAAHRQHRDEREHQAALQDLDWDRGRDTQTQAGES